MKIAAQAKLRLQCHLYTQPSSSLVRHPHVEASSNSVTMLSQPLFYLYCFVVSSAVLASQDQVCQSEKYSRFLPLIGYSPAESFCSINYPQPPVTISVSVDAQASYQEGYHPPLKTWTTNIKGLKAQLPREDGFAAIFSNLTAGAESFVSTACSCIRMPETVIVSLSDF